VSGRWRIEIEIEMEIEIEIEIEIDFTSINQPLMHTTSNIEPSTSAAAYAALAPSALVTWPLTLALSAMPVHVCTAISKHTSGGSLG
jgi:hypothetical protein